ncbi:MAG: tRNA (guanosine(37)-N1)-methyltransferase TrmD [bacterium]
MIFTILTIFPESLSSYVKIGMVNRALKKKIIKIKTINLRGFTLDKRKTVDDKPYGGGAGMVMKIEPIYRALKKILGKSVLNKQERKRKEERVILLTANGKEFKQADARRIVKYKHVILICGRYEGIDARVEQLVDEKLSIGEYVLTGGELAAGVIIDSASRLLPEVLGDEQSAVHESHSCPGYKEHPQYTRPETFNAGGKRKWKVPPILLTGDHKKIELWRQKHSI